MAHTHDKRRNCGRKLFYLPRQDLTGGADADAAADGRWWGTTGGGGGAAMGDRMFCAFRARSAYESGLGGIWTVGDAIPEEVLVRAFWVKGWVGWNKSMILCSSHANFFQTRLNKRSRVQWPLHGALRIHREVTAVNAV